MENMPYRDVDSTVTDTPTSFPEPFASVVAPVDSSWRHGLPTMVGLSIRMRELRLGDAPALFAAMSTEEVSRFISPPPTTVAGFERFIHWAQAQRANGQYLCFAVTPAGSDTAVGLFQLRSLDSDFGNAEWGFALAVEYWGSGMFTEGAELMLEFAFDTVGVRRLEARAAIKNGRGNGALRKLGAVQEGVLRRSFVKNGEYLDQALWTIIGDEWRQAKAVWGPRVIH